MRVFGVYTFKYICKVIVVGQGEGLVPVVTVEPEVDVEAVTRGYTSDRLFVGLCFDLSEGIKSEEEWVEGAVSADVGFVLDSLK